MVKPLCVIVGVGPGNGAAFAKRFAKEGYRLALLARTSNFINELAGTLDDGYVYLCDVTDANSVHLVFDQIKQELGQIDVLIYNAGSGYWGNIEKIKADEFEHNWRVNAFGLFLVSQQVIPIMKQSGQRKIIIIGATASKRGGKETAAFAPAKAAQRSLAESMAKYLWPIGIHVALIIIDGIVDLAETRKRMPDKPDDFFVKSDDVASTVYMLSQQPSSCWTFEIEIRPFGEVW